MSIRKGDDVIAGASVGFIGKPAWSQAVVITTTSYTVPADGMLVGYLTTGVTDAMHVVYINNVPIALSRRSPSNHDFRTADIQCVVNKGDVVTADFTYVVSSESSLHFVPFEYSGVSDINVITPEYIRNMNTPDYTRRKTISASPWIADEDVYIVYATYGSISITNRDLYIDGVRVDVTDTENSISTTSFTGRVAKGSVITCARIANQNVFKAFPYKA